jgi:dimethylglycine dehydrogenase
MIFSPDLSPLIGPHPAVQNYFCANGVMAGFNQGAGIGRVLSEWIIGGEPELDIFNWDVARFGDWADTSYTEATTKYFYEKRSEKVFPHQEFDVGRPIKKPQIYERLAQAGSVFGVSFGLEHPNWFAAQPGQSDSLTYRQPNWWGPVADEGKRIRNELGLMEFSAMAKFEISGPGAETWLDLIVTNRLPKLGRITLSPMLSPKGRVIGDFSIARVAHDRFMVLGADYMQLSFMRHFNQYLPKSGVSVKNLSNDLAGLHICGPNAQALISRLADREMDTTNFKFMSADKMRIGGIDNVMVFRISFTGECGYEMYLPRNRQAKLFDILRNEGSDLGLGLVGTRSLMHTRLEKSFAAWGLELSSDYTALDCNMMAHVKPEKGDFIGRNAVLSYNPQQEKFVTFTVDIGDCVIWGDEAIFFKEKPIGYVTSGGWGPVTEKHIALGYISIESYNENNDYFIEIMGKMRLAKLSTRPLYDPMGHRMRK